MCFFCQQGLSAVSVCQTNCMGLSHGGVRSVLILCYHMRDVTNIISWLKSSTIVIFFVDKSYNLSEFTEMIM